MPHHVAHQPDEDQVHRPRQRLPHADRAAVVLGLEVLEVVQPAAGEEALVRAGRIAPLQRRLQHRRQALVASLRQMAARPAPQRVLRVDRQRGQLRRAQGLPARMQRGHQLQVGDQGAQLGGRAQVQAGTLVQVEGLVEAVGLHPQQVAVLAALVEREAEHDLAGVVALVQQVLAEQPGLPRAGPGGQAAQQGAGRALHLAVQRGGHRQVQPVQVIGARHPQQGLQLAAHRIDGLAIGEGAGLRRIGAGLQRQRQRQRGIAQRWRDHPRLGQQAQVAVGQLAQVGLALVQVMGRPALRDHQRQGLLEGQRPGRQRRRCSAGGLQQQAVELVEIAAVPGPQAVAQAVDLTNAGLGRQRHAVQVVQHDLPAPRQGVGAVQVGAQRRRGHLAQLGLRRVGAALGRMVVLLDLRGQRAATGTGV